MLLVEKEITRVVIVAIHMHEFTYIKNYLLYILLILLYGQINHDKIIH